MNNVPQNFFHSKRSVRMSRLIKILNFNKNIFFFLAFVCLSCSICTNHIKMLSNLLMMLSRHKENIEKEEMKNKKTCMVILILLARISHFNNNYLYISYFFGVCFFFFVLFWSLSRFWWILFFSSLFLGNMV